MKRYLILLLALFFVSSSVMAQSSTNYKLKGYEFGGGGSEGINSNSYSLLGILGESAGELGSANYKANVGLVFSQNAAVPPAPTLVNDTGSRYNKLKITINKYAPDPTDAKYAIAISTDNFVTTQWVQNNNTIGSALGAEDFQTYPAWGGASGTYIIGLSRNTTYKVKVKSTQGKYTESPLSPLATAATVDLSLSFDIDIGGGTDPGETVAPYSVALGNLSMGSVTTASNRVWVDLDTNAESGGFVYVYDQYGGLKSSALNYTISSTSTNLASGAVAEGFGLQGASKTQSAGGPLDYVSPYNGIADNVGLIDATIRQIFTSSANPITAARGSMNIKAKAAATTPASTDYGDTLTMIASTSF